MNISERIILHRTCDAFRIPSGEQVSLPGGAEVCITQSLGGTYTVMTNNGALVRIASKDADALGKEVVHISAATSSTGLKPEDIEQMVWDQLRTCFDPEIPVNIVDLGLVYHCQVTPTVDEGHRVEIEFTLTAPGCGMGEVLKVDIEEKVSSLPEVTDVEVEVVFEPPWNQDMLTEAAKLELGLL